MRDSTVDVHHHILPPSYTRALGERIGHQGLFGSPPAREPNLLERLKAGIQKTRTGLMEKLEDAAATLGADRFRVFLTVTLPLAMPGLIAGMVLCFAKALGEFGATITFVSNIPGETQTISAAIYSFTQIPGGDAAAGRLVAVAIVISLAALVAAEWLARRAGMRFHGEG